MKINVKFLQNFRILGFVIVVSEAGLIVTVLFWSMIVEWNEKRRFKQ